MWFIKTLSLIALMLVGVTLPVLADDPTSEKQFFEKIDAAKGDAAFFVAYGKERAEPIAIIEAPGFRVVKQGKGASMTIGDLVEVLNELGKIGEKDVDTISSTVIFVHGSPGCYIKTASGGWKCICP